MQFQQTLPAGRSIVTLVDSGEIVNAKAHSTIPVNLGGNWVPAGVETPLDSLADGPIIADPHGDSAYILTVTYDVVAPAKNAKKA